MKTPITILFLCAFAAFSVIVKNELLVDRSPLEALKIGQQMPDFTLADAEGHEFRLNLDGHITLGVSCHVRDRPLPCRPFQSAQ